jgi:flagellar FliJ protein
MPFRFSLQPVLEHRKRIEESRQRECGEALSRLELARSEMKRLKEEIRRRHDQIRSDQRTPQSGAAAFARRALIENWICVQRGEIGATEAIIVHREQEWRQSRDRLIGALKDRKVIEKLRDRESRDYRRNEARSEMKTFDEIAVRDFANERRREKAAAHTERIAS